MTDSILRFPHPRDDRNRSRRQRPPRAAVKFELPADEALENAVVALCVDDAVAMLVRCAKLGVNGESFSSELRRTVFAAVEGMVAAGAPVDGSTVAVELTSRGLLTQAADAAGAGPLPMSYAEFAAMLTVPPRMGSEDFYVRKLRALALRRKVVLQAQAAAALALEAAGDEKDVEEMCAQVEQRFQGLTRARLGISAARNGSLPPLMAWGDLVGREARPEPARLVEGLIHRGGKVMLGGGSKSFKTWVLIDLALSVATGTPWWGMRTARGRVLFVNFELQTWSFERRVRAIAEAKKIGEAENFVSWHLRGHSRDLAELIPQFLTQVAGSKFDMIILDPIYKCLGDRDENANGEVSALLNEIEALAVRSEAAVVFGHHFSKGNQAAKDARDRVSGAGAWTRDPDTVLTLTPHEEEGHFTVESVLRDQAPKEPMVVRWKMPVMEWAPGADPSKLKQAGAPAKGSPHDVAALLGEEEMLGTTELERRIMKKLEVSESAAKRYMIKAVELGLLSKTGAVYRRARVEEAK